LSRVSFPVAIVLLDEKVRSSVQETCLKGEWLLIRDALCRKDGGNVVDFQSMVEKVVFEVPLVAHQAVVTLAGEQKTCNWSRIDENIGTIPPKSGESRLVVSDREDVALVVPLLLRKMALDLDAKMKVKLPRLSSCLDTSSEHEGWKVVILEGVVVGVGFAFKLRDRGSWNFREMSIGLKSLTVSKAVELAKAGEEINRSIALVIQFEGGKLPARVRMRPYDLLRLLGDNPQGSSSKILKHLNSPEVAIPCTIHDSQIKSLNSSVQHLTSFSPCDEKQNELTC